MKLLLILLYIFPLIFSLKPHHFPNGKLVSFKVNSKSPHLDLVNIEPGKASIITKNWLQNIVIDVFNNKKKIFEYDNLHIVSKINELDTIIQELNQYKNNENKDMFLSWYPEGNHGRKENLFIIYLQLSLKSKELIVKQIIQSPFWDPIQINSEYLKNALEDLNSKNKDVTLIFDYLYEKDIRYKLAWSTWSLKKDLDT
jgi:hypothetical protein